MTAVVAAELYAGNHEHREKRIPREICKAHRALGHSGPSAAAGLMPAFCCAARGVPRRKAIRPATFAICLIALGSGAGWATL